MRGKTLLFFLCGVVTALATGYGLQFLRPLLTQRLEQIISGGGPVIVAPIVEEAMRMAALVALAHVRGPSRPDQYRWPVFCFGLGFAFLEALMHWFGVGGSRDDSLLIHIWGPWSPILLHVGLTILAALFIIAQRPLIGVVINMALHSVHNAYVHHALSRSTLSTLSIALPIQLLLMAGAIALLMLAWRSRAPAMQFRTDL
ncbi:MAG: hypothetical protein ABUL73_02705 [Alphaproteobacteria bacterium]